MNERSGTTAIDQIPANRRVVEELHAHGYLTASARQAALEFLNPHIQWGLWISRLLLVVGSALVLSGVVYFFAYNWSQIPPAVKLAGIQIGVIALVLSACRCGLTQMTGQVLMVAASVLVGVFLAVFGQIYQTGADAYQLFLTWSLLILGWCMISNFAAQWTLWLAVTNVALVLWWVQAGLPTNDTFVLIFVYLALLNGAMLALREFGAQRGHDWVAARWTRVLPTLITLGVLLIAVLWMIESRGDASSSVMLAGIIGLLGHVTLYAVYRHGLRDIWALAATVLSGCLLLIATVNRVVDEVLGDFTAAGWMILGLATLAIFSAAIVYLRSTMKQSQVSLA